MVSVDEVYKTVLYILNKEQRGYMSPAEFNSVATQVQLEIFEQYFEDLNVQLRVPENDSEYANRQKTIKEKISFFETDDNITGGSPFDLSGLTTKVHRLGTIEYLPQNAGFATTSSYNPVEVQEVSQHEFNLIRRSSLTAPSYDWPIFTLKDDKVITLPDLDNIEVYYVRKPKDPVWSYKVGSLGQYIYDPTGPIGTLQNFEISNIDKTEIILRILAYAGIIIRDPNIVSTATQMAINEDNIEKQ